MPRRPPGSRAQPLSVLFRALSVCCLFEMIVSTNPLIQRLFLLFILFDLWLLANFKVIYLFYFFLTVNQFFDHHSDGPYGARSESSSPITRSSRSHSGSQLQSDAISNGEDSSVPSFRNSPELEGDLSSAARDHSSCSSAELLNFDAGLGPSFRVPTSKPFCLRMMPITEQ